MRDLRPYQIQVIDEVRQYVAGGGRRCIVQLACGAGKTRISAALIDELRPPGTAAVFTVPRTILIDQTAESFRTDGITDVGIMQGQHPDTDPSRSVQVASIQTLTRRTINPPGIVIVDECHIRFASLEKLLAKTPYADTPVIGLSATPWSKGLGKVFDALIIGADQRDLQDHGFLCRAKAYAPANPDLSSVKVDKGEYQNAGLSAVMSSKVIVGDLVHSWNKHAVGKPTVIYSVDLAHAREIRGRFQAAGVAIEYVDGSTPREEREAIRRRFEAQETTILVNCDTLQIGFDSNIHCIIDACPTLSEIRFVQRIGRVLRPAPDKEAVILDHAGNHLRHGYAWEISHSHLDDGKAKKKPLATAKKVGMWTCPECQAVNSKTAVCSECGHEIVKKPKHQVIDGELFDYTRPPRSRDAPMSKPEEWMMALRTIQIERGYKPGWAPVNFKEKFGRWPMRWEEGLGAGEVPDYVRSWVRSQMIRHARSRQRSVA